VYTPYDRAIAVSEDKAVNYLIQSTSSDMLLTSAMNLAKELANKKSFVSFCIHDSVVIDMATEEKDLVMKLVEKFSETKFGDLKVNLSVGKDFGNMRKVL
jgi:DNA polymerase I-like protein with 3'-5' exonuclease and polymerase domains